MLNTEQDNALIWELPLRIFHWSLVLAISWSWFSVEILEEVQQHF